LNNTHAVEIPRLWIPLSIPKLNLKSAFYTNLTSPSLPWRSTARNPFPIIHISHWFNFSPSLPWRSTAPIPSPCPSALWLVLLFSFTSPSLPWRSTAPIPSPSLLIGPPNTYSLLIGPPNNYSLLIGPPNAHCHAPTAQPGRLN
jgi:hypothetical protein